MGPRDRPQQPFPPFGVQFAQHIIEKINIAITIEAKVMEGAVAARLAAIQKQEPDVAIGSYPFYRDTGTGVQLVARGRDRHAVERAAAAIEAHLRELGVAAQRIKQVVPDGQS